MNIIFIILLISFNELLYQLASHMADFEMQFLPSRNRLKLIMLCSHLSLLILCIWYLGWVYGIVVFLASFFSLLHSLFGWILNIPSLFYKSEKQITNTLQYQIWAIYPVFLLSVVFCIVSFFTTEFMSLTYFFEDNLEILPALVVIALILLIIRIAVVKKLSQDLE